MKAILRALCSLLCFVNLATAAPVEFGTARMLDGDAGLLVGADVTPVLAMDFAGPGDVEINGIHFLADNPAEQGSVVGEILLNDGDDQKWESRLFEPWSGLFNSMVITSFDSGTLTFRLSGLKTGTTYRAQFFFGQRSVLRRFTVQNADDTSTTGEVITNSEDPDFGGWYFTAVWTADAATQNFLFVPGKSNRALLSGVSVVEIR